MPLVTSQMRWLAYRRMHALIHNLVTIAALLERKPVIPDVPCEYIRTVQQRAASTPVHRSRFGVSHPSIVVTGPKDKPVCRLAPGTWRPGGPDQCYHNRIMSQFDYDDFLTSEHVTPAWTPQKPLPNLTLPQLPVEPPAGGDASATEGMVDALKRLCAAHGKSHATEQLLQLDGLLPIRDLLIDAAIGTSEFASERARLASGRPRWRSQLQGAQLRELEGVCPGAKQLIGWRKACVGYFLAE